LECTREQNMNARDDAVVAESREKETAEQRRDGGDDDKAARVVPVASESSREEQRQTSREDYSDGPINDATVRHANAISASAAEFLSLDAADSVLVLVLYRLPVLAERDSKSGAWRFKWDDDAIYLTSAGLKAALEANRRVVWVGILNSVSEVCESECASIARTLASDFSCIPVFLPRATLIRFYTGFCKGVLWPLFHMTSSVPTEAGARQVFDRGLWQTYTTVNRAFSDVVVSVYQGDTTSIWIHDYHLLLLPLQLRRRLTGAKIGFYLHTPWPSSDVYRTLPVRDEILRSVLSVTVLGFNLFDYARHFISCCTRLLDLEHIMRNGNIIMNYCNRRVVIRVSHIGIDPARFDRALSCSPFSSSPHTHATTENKDGDAKADDTDGAAEGGGDDNDDEQGTARLVALEVERIRARVGEHRRIVCAIDDLDVIKGLPFKLLAMEQLLINFPAYRDQLVLYQVANPRGVPRAEPLRAEIYEIVDRINEDFGSEDYAPVVYIEGRLSLVERVALYQAADAMLLTPIRDGLNLIPYEFLVSSREGHARLILSENIGCSRALFSAVRVNPWDSEEIMYTLDMALNEDDQQVAEEQAADVRNLRQSTIANWALSFVADLDDTHEPRMRHRLALGLDSRAAVELADLNMVDPVELMHAFQASSFPIFVINYDTLIRPASSVPGQTSSSTAESRKWSSCRPSQRILSALNTLSTVGTVCVFSDLPQDTLLAIFGAACPLVSLLAESGLFLLHAHRVRNGDDEQDGEEDDTRECGGARRFGESDSGWVRTVPQDVDMSWVDVAREIMTGYCERTDGSYLETTQVSLTWHYINADPTFGSWQAKELRNHLFAVLGAFDVEVVQGDGSLHVRLKDLAKFALEVAWRGVTQSSHAQSSIDFVMASCDSRADESMLAALDTLTQRDSVQRVFKCSVEVQPQSQREYFVRSTNDMEDLLVMLSRSKARRETPASGSERVREGSAG